MVDLSPADNRRSFRTDINALRGICVASVVLYHAGVPGFSGGFVGVDVFFVISGYLITGLLIRELSVSGTIDLVKFWSRRAWRLLPNALVNLTVVLIFVWFFEPAVEHAMIGKDVISALFNGANYWFSFRAIDYFDNLQSVSPVLHYWSLSIEEQFYIVWPCALILMVKLSGVTGTKQVLKLAILVIVLSCAACLIWMQESQPAAFFHTEARVWQIAVGAALAAANPFAALPARVNTIASAMGLLLIFISICWFSDHQRFPGWRSLVPVAGAFLVLGASAGSNSALGKTLNLSLLQWTGTYSYSLYLWHWPILLFVTPHLPGPWFLAISLSLVLVLAASKLAFDWVEEPFRKRHALSSWPSNRKLAVSFVAVAMVAVGAIVSTQLDWLHGEDDRVVLARINAAKSDAPRLVIDGCQPGWDTPELNSCRYGDPDGAKTVILFGDSYAEHLFDGVDEAAKRAGWSMQLWTHPSCPPMLIEDAVSLIANHPTCDEWRKRAIEQLSSQLPDLVIISSWTGIAYKMKNVDGSRADRAVSLSLWKRSFEALLQKLTKNGIAVAVVRSTPRGNFRHLAGCMSASLSDQCGKPKLDAIDQIAPDVSVASSLKNVKVVDLSNAFCGANVCYSVRNNNIVYRDHASHMTATFSRSLAARFAELFQER